MTGRSAKNKGVRLQNYVAQKLYEVFTSLEEGDIKPAIMGESGVDINLSPAAKRVFPFSVECKNVEKLNFWAAYEQAKQNTIKDTEPLLVVKKNHKKPIVVLDFDLFLRLLLK